MVRRLGPVQFTAGAQQASGSASALCALRNAPRQAHLRDEGDCAAALLVLIRIREGAAQRSNLGSGGMGVVRSRRQRSAASSNDMASAPAGRLAQAVTHCRRPAGAVDHASAPKATSRSLLRPLGAAHQLNESRAAAQLPHEASDAPSLLLGALICIRGHVCQRQRLHGSDLGDQTFATRSEPGVRALAAVQRHG